MSALRQLVITTRTLGDLSHEYVVVGEGNTSVRADEQTFWVKASGHRITDPGREFFLRVNLTQVLDLLDEPALSESEARS